MSKQHRIVWYEGMALDPHHFQQLDRYYHSMIDFRIRAITSYGWGLETIAINKEALANGQFTLVRCSGITPDGLSFSMPDVDPLPGSRNIRESFPATEDKLLVYLCLPIERSGGRNCILDETSGGETIRFKTRNYTIVDENTGTNERQITVAYPSIQLRFNNEPLENFVTLPVAEIRRRPDGGFFLYDKFIPPCVKCGTSERLLAIINGLLEHLVGKRASLSERRQQKPSGQIEFSTTDITLFWLLNTVNAFIPRLNHFFSVGFNHPEELYKLMLELAGQLTTFAYDISIHPRDFPKYEHSNLSDCFNKLDEIIHALLDKVIPPSNYISIALQKVEELLSLGRIDDQALFATGQFYLTCSGDVPERKIIDELPRIIKIASKEDIINLERFALPGLGITYTSRPPVGLPSRPDLHYFHLEKVGALWDAICKERAIAIRIPPGFIGLKMELLVMRQ